MSYCRYDPLIQPVFIDCLHNGTALGPGDTSVSRTDKSLPLMQLTL